ncbi:MAG: septum formation inhibitor Maf [Rubrivivax sp.]|nr:septum formation inhibitor Maf [Rubrivivax sp.]
MVNPDFIYLASQSPRRAQLLAQLGVAHRPLLPDRGENAEALEEERSGEPPGEYVRRVTLRKLAAAQRRLARRQLPAAPILCADTTVALGRRILGKPESDEHAAEMLRALSGRTHRVMTAVAISAGKHNHMLVSTSRVRFAELSERTIDLYVASGEPQGKAGAYGIQGRIAAWIEHIEGSYTGIMGLPLHETTTLLSRARVRLDL